MEEYVKYCRESVKIGTCEDMYYTSYQKFTRLLEAGRLKKDDGSLPPEEYIKPNLGDRFRFPFPDEDGLRFGEIKDTFYRGMVVKLSDPSIIGDFHGKGQGPYAHQLEITQQKLLHRISDQKLILAVVCRNPADGKSFRIEDDADVQALLKQIIKHHLVLEDIPQQKQVYRELASKMLRGYRLDAPAVKQQIKQIYRLPIGNLSVSGLPYAVIL